MKVRIGSICMIILIILTLHTLSFATITVDKYKTEPTLTDAEGAQDLGNKIIGTIQMVGVIVSVVSVLLLGIKYMMGSTEERAEYKKTMIPMVVGMFLLFGISSLLGVLYDVIANIN